MLVATDESGEYVFDVLVIVHMYCTCVWFSSAILSYLLDIELEEVATIPEACRLRAANLAVAGILCPPTSQSRAGRSCESPRPR